MNYTTEQLARAVGGTFDKGDDSVGISDFWTFTPDELTRLIEIAGILGERKMWDICLEAYPNDIAECPPLPAELEGLT